MKIIEQGHQILHMDNIERIELAGRTCYKSEDRITTDCDCDCEGFDILGPGRTKGSRDCPKCNGTGRQVGTAPQFARMLIKRGHEAMIEHASATVKFITNRGVTHEQVRHRLCAFGQESTRYVNYKDGVIFVRPSWCGESEMGQAMIDEILDSIFFNQTTQRLVTHKDLAFPSAEEVVASAWQYAEGAYRTLIDLGWPAEKARGVLPNDLKTEIVVTANFREWRHIFKLRAIGTSGKPHPQMQALMIPVLEEFAEQCPSIFGDLADMLARSE